MTDQSTRRTAGSATTRKATWLTRWKRIIQRRRVELITDVTHRNPTQDRLHREKVYNWLQGARIPFLLASAVTYMRWHDVVISGILFVIMIPLPWIAVVIGNGQGSPRDNRTQNVYKPQIIRDRMAYAQKQVSQAQKQRELEASQRTITGERINGAWAQPPGQQDNVRGDEDADENETPLHHDITEEDTSHISVGKGAGHKGLFTTVSFTSAEKNDDDDDEDTGK